MENITHYTVSNKITGTSRDFKTRAAARKYADSCDTSYGSVIAFVKAVWA